MADVQILIVEDEAIVAKHIEQRLIESGYNVPEVCLSGEEAIHCAAKYRPDLILMDIMLQGEMDGIDAAQKIRTEFDIPVVYLTAFSDDETLQRAKITEPFGYVLKPVEIRELVSNIEMALYKHKMERRLRKSETRYRILSELTSDYAYSARIESRNELVYEWVTEAFTKITGFKPADLARSGGWERLIHPDSMVHVSQHFQACFEGQSHVQEYRIITKDGEVRWIRDYIQPEWDAEKRRVIRMYGASQDITEEKNAEMQIHALTQELLTAQESERIAIAAYLQKSVAGDLASAQEQLNSLLQAPSLPDGVRRKLSDYYKKLKEIIDHVTELSSDLHPPELEQQGLTAALSAFCDDFSTKNDIKLKFKAAGFEGLELDSSIGINLFRLLQEALINIKKHAKAKNVEVGIVASYPDIAMKIIDDGIGFDVNEQLFHAVKQKKFGLKRMEERVNLLNGTIKLQSEPQKGTTVWIKVPISSRQRKPL